MSRTLADHDEIRQWTEARGGSPLSMDVPDGTGSRTLLELTFGQHALNADANEGPDRGGYALVDWDDWFKEFDGQGLALKVRYEEPGLIDNDFEFVSRESGEREISAGAEQPAPGTVDDPNADGEFGGSGV